ncbi:hypothetical protein [Paenibacillus beijingensis]|nr:hypothetical protein [Paenibacillus beijingensis]
MNCEHFRFVEKHRPYRDLTFKFFADGKLIILDNNTDRVITPRDLKGDSMDFYVRQRIAFIKKDLVAKTIKYA